MSLINAGLQEFKALYDLGKNAYTKARARMATPLRVEKLAEDVFSSRIEFGKVVTVQGKLSRYGLTYKPLTYAQRIGAPCKVTDDGGFQTRFQPFQYPVQTLPTLKGENDEYYIAFLYSNNFNGFILQDDPAKDLSIDTHVLLVEPQHRAIPVLLSANDLQNTSEREVTLTGVVSLLPDALIKTVVNTLCPTREALYYHFLRTSSPHAGFCIDCRREENSDFNVKNRLRDIHGALYVEGHFEGVADDRYEKEYKASVPKGAWTNTVVSGLGFTVPSAPGIVFYLSLDKNVSLVRKGAGTFGFYTQTNKLD